MRMLLQDDSNTQSAIGVLYLKGAKMKEVEVTGGKAGFQIKFDKRAGGGEKTKHSHSKYHLSFASEEEAKQWRAAIVEVRIVFKTFILKFSFSYRSCTNRWGYRNMRFYFYLRSSV